MLCLTGLILVLSMLATVGTAAARPQAVAANDAALFR
jgi:hypothetical protein